MTDSIIAANEMVSSLAIDLRRTLKEFRIDDSGSPDLVCSCAHEVYAVEWKEAPVPDSIYATLAVLLGFPRGCRGEKTHWVIPFKYRGVRCSLAHEKFGLRLYTEQKCDQSGIAINPKEVIGKLRRGVLITESRLLAPLAKSQLARGNLTIANHYQWLDNIYQYFREQAGLQYHQSVTPSPPPAGGEVIDVARHITESFNLYTRSRMGGFYNSLAMIDAYFSRLEHLLVLCLPFSNYSRASDDLVEFIGFYWGKKYKRILPIDTASMAKTFYDRLDTVKERFRNPFAHGGFKKKGASLFFHLSGVGAIPASLSATEGHPDFGFEETTFQDVCLLFDEFDSWLEQEGMPFAVKYAKSGLDIAFDAKFISELSMRMQGVEPFEEWLDYLSYQHAIFANAEY